ncbi:hypothetical protein QS428_12290 [Staphylococcus pseudintermedius]|nr:hypothetical protein QS428_12290 [Staphylococcus pseudintermedius]
MTVPFQRVHLIVMDSVGIGEGPDAKDYRYDMYLDEFEYIDERVGKCVLPPQDYIRTIFSIKLPYYDTKNFK